MKLQRRTPHFGDVYSPFSFIDPISKVFLNGLDFPFDMGMFKEYKPSKKGDATVNISVTVNGKTQKEQNKLLAEELRKVADNLEKAAEELTEEAVESAEPVVDVKITRV